MNKFPEFLKEFNISKTDFKSTGLVWSELLKIKKDYEAFKPELTPPANYLIETFHKVKKIHSVRFRIKNSSHLIEKIVRKKLQAPDKIIDISNYKDKITDLIGIRALHLFKEDWISIHNFITGNWNLKDVPIAYYRKGDSSDYIEIFQKYGCKTEEHPFGYRSVHYLVETNPNKNTYTSEIQVRTIFEEGWSEIDHSVRYPYDKNKKLLSQFLVIFNRLAGSADEMGSYVQYLKKELETKEKEFNEADAKKIQSIKALKGRIKDLELTPKVALQFENEIDEILKLPTFDPSFLDSLISDYKQIELPDFSKLNFPDYSKIKLPDYTDIEIPDYNKIKLLDLPEIKTSDQQDTNSKKENLKSKPTADKKKPKKNKD